MAKVKIALLTVLIVAVTGGLAGAGVYFYGKYQKAQSLLKNPALAVQEETKDLVNKLSRHIVLDTNETPVIAKVTDVSQLAKNPFFKQAKTGDVVVIFQEANKAVLYRIDTDRVVNIASPLNTQPEVAGSGTDSAQMQSAKLAIYNGTQTAGLAGKAEVKIKTDLPAIMTSEKINSKGNYTKSQVVIINPAAANLGQKLADEFGAQLAGLPADETRPDADLLLIVGEDFKP